MSNHSVKRLQIEFKIVFTNFFSGEVPSVLAEQFRTIPHGHHDEYDVCLVVQLIHRVTNAGVGVGLQEF